jgi:hypothetical protein
MARAMTQKEMGETLAYIVEHMVTKSEFFALQTQVNSIEREIREMKHDRLGIRVEDLEEKVFGKSRQP